MSNGVCEKLEHEPWTKLYVVGGPIFFVAGSFSHAMTSSSTVQTWVEHSDHLPFQHPTYLGYLMSRFYYFTISLTLADGR
jgi:hypothetical protein